MQEFMHVPFVLNGSPVFERELDYKIVYPFERVNLLALQGIPYDKRREGKEYPVNALGEWEIFQDPQDDCVLGVDVAEG